jgi:hypothetical protein
MKNHGDGRIQRRLGFCLVLVFSVSLFAYTAGVRQPWFGLQSTGEHHWLTHSSLLFTDNLVRDGLWKLRCAMVWCPDSVEFRHLSERAPYLSYPPGAVLPLYLISLISGAEPTLELIMAWNLFNHLCIAVVLSLLVFVLLERLGYPVSLSIAFAFLCAAIELLTPGPMYYHQNVYFADQAVILPFAVYVALEIFRDLDAGRNAVDESERQGRRRRWTSLLQSTIAFVGALTDWFFVILVLCVYCKRILQGRLPHEQRSWLRRSGALWLPVFLAMGFFAVQLTYFEAWPHIFEQFLHRTASTEATRAKAEAIGFWKAVWRGHIGGSFGGEAKFLLWAGLAVLVAGCLRLAVQIRRGGASYERKRLLLSCTGITLVPCFLHTYFLYNHTLAHSFSALKFSVPLAMAIFVCIPLLLMEEASDLLPRWRKNAAGAAAPSGARRPAFVFVLLVLSCGALYLGRIHTRFPRLFPEPDDFLVEIGDFVRSHVGYEDVLFSPDSPVGLEPPHLLAYTRKRIYALEGVKDLLRFRDLDRPHAIRVFVRDVRTATLPAGVEDIVLERIEQDHMALLRLDTEKVYGSPR